MRSYLINLATRPDRLERSMEELNKVGFTPERFEAFTGDNRCLAFNKSQYHCLKEAVKTEEEIFAIFEDDVAFTENAQCLIKQALSQLPEHFGVLHLGCNVVGMSTTEWEMPEQYSENLAILNNCWMTHAIIWSRAAAVYVLKNFPFYTDEYEKEGLTIFDEWLRTKVYPDFECFVMRPMVAYQRPDLSDIWGTHGDYTSSFELGNKYLMGL
jgi:GR25 family glycosyltransferase involved in LPS biosynthesis